MTGMQVGEFALLRAPPCRLRRCSQTRDNADRHFFARAEPDGLVDCLGNGRCKRLKDARRELKVAVVHQNGVRNGHIAADHVAVHGELQEVDVEFVERVGHFRPDGFRRNACDVLAGRAAEGRRKTVAKELRFLIRQIPQNRQEPVRDTQLAAGYAALLRSGLADILKEGADLLGLHERVALGVGKAEPAALGGVVHGYKAPFVVIVVSGVRVGHRWIARRRRGLLGFQPGNFRAAGVDLALDTGNLGGVRAAIVFKSVHSRRHGTALFVGARLGDLAKRLAKLLFSRGKAVSRLFQRRQLRAKRGDLAVQD